MGRHLHETAFLIVTALFIPVQSRAQSPGQVSGAEAWLKTVPLTTDLQGYYHWRDFSGDSVRTNLYDAKGAAYGGEFTQRHTWIRTFNFNPALNFSEGNQPKESLLKYSNLAQMTVIGVFAPTTTAYNKDEVLYAVSGRKGAGSLVSRDKAVGQQGIEPLNYGSTAGEDLLYSGSERQTAEEFKSTSPRIVSYIRAYAPVHSVWGEGRRATITTGTYRDGDVNFSTCSGAVRSMATRPSSSHTAGRSRRWSAGRWRPISPSDTASRSTAHTIRGLATFHGTGTKAPPTTTG